MASTPLTTPPPSVAISGLTSVILPTSNVTTILTSEAITFEGNASSTTIAATTTRLIEPQKLATSSAAPVSYSYYDCCLPVEAGWITVGSFIFITLLILVVCLFGMYHLRKKERKKCKEVLKRYNDDYQQQQNSKTPSAIVTSESKMFSPKIASKTKKLSKSPQNSKNGLKSSKIAKPSNTRNLSAKSKQKFKEKCKKLNKSAKALSKKGNASIKKIKTRLFQTKSKSGQKTSKIQSKPSPLKKKPEARKASPASNPRRSKDRVVFHEGKHHRL